MKTGIFVALLTLCTGLSQPVLAQSPIPLTGKMDLALTQKLDAASPGDDVRVIIEFDMPQKAPGAMAADASLDARRAAVQSGRSAMMQRENMRGVAERRINRGVRRTYDYTPHIAFEGTPAEIEAFARNRKVKRIFIDEAVPPTLLNSTAQINAPQVWAQGLDGTGHAVAILDTGVDNDHAFFGNRIVAEACFSSNVPSQGATSVCPNGQETQFGNNAGDNCSLSVNGCDHGTHVAGIAAGNEGSSRDPGFFAVQLQQPVQRAPALRSVLHQRPDRRARPCSVPEQSARDRRGQHESRRRALHLVLPFRGAGAVDQ